MFFPPKSLHLLERVTKVLLSEMISFLGIALKYSRCSQVLFV